MAKSSFRMALERQWAHQHNHALRGEICPLKGKPWPWRVKDCPLMTRLNKLMPIEPAVTE